MRLYCRYCFQRSCLIYRDIYDPGSLTNTPLDTFVKCYFSLLVVKTIVLLNTNTVNA